MSTLSRKDVAHLARLARLAVTDEELDLYAGQLSAVLDELGVADSTYFIFSSDHGYNLGHHRLPDNKFNSYMHDLRIPFLIRGPGISGGQLPARLPVQPFELPEQGAVHRAVVAVMRDHEASVPHLPWSAAQLASSVEHHPGVLPLRERPWFVQQHEGLRHVLAVDEHPLQEVL